MYLRDFFALKPFHDYSLCSVCILPQPAFYSQSAVGILHTVCILPPVRSLRLTLTDKEMLSLWWQVNLEAFGIMLEIQLLEKVKTKNFERRKIKPVSTRIQRSETKRNLQWLFELDYQTFQDISLPSQWSNSHCPTDHFCSCWVEVILYSLACTKRHERQWSCNASMITEYGKNMLVYTSEIDFLYKSYTPHS